MIAAIGSDTPVFLADPTPCVEHLCVGGYGVLRVMTILDCCFTESEWHDEPLPMLLDGNGGELHDLENPVWLTFLVDANAGVLDLRNSAGQPYSPEVDLRKI